MEKYITVAFNLPTGKCFWYKVPSQFKMVLKRGQRVLVPFRKKEMVGFVVEEFFQKPEGKLKELINVFDKTSLFNDSLFQLARWISEYYSCSLGQALHSIFPFSFPYQEETESFSPDLKKMSTGKEGVHLVKPGNQKFELIISWIKEKQKLKKQVLVLVPEINSIIGLQKKMEKRGIKIAVFHSRIPIKERYNRWLAMKRGEIDIALGTRSLVFAPFPNIGLIIVDKEESADYKQRETPKYNVRKIAIKRGELESFPVLLMSNSPSLESWYKAKTGVYKLISFIGKEKLSSFFTVDLKKEKRKNRIFSELLQQKMEEALKKKLLTLIFVPRRGYANFLLCADCGEVMRCPNCNIGLSFHLGGGMICHCCGFQKEAPLICPFCEGRGLKKIGWGTQRIEIAAKKRFPQARVKRFDLDVFKSFSPNLLSEIKKEKIDILIGTQLLMKEEVISMVDVVGIMLLDILLNMPDFRATEHAFHFLSKIRQNLKKDSSLIIQTYNPTHYVLTGKNDEEFYEEELKIRQTLEYPPFQGWIRVFFEGKIKNKVKDRSEKLAKEFKKENLIFLGPSPCPFSKIKGKYRYHIILRDDGTRFLQEIIKKMNSKITKGSVKMGIDVDPLFTM